MIRIETKVTVKDFGETYPSHHWSFEEFGFRNKVNNSCERYGIMNYTNTEANEWIFTVVAISKGNYSDHPTPLKIHQLVGIKHNNIELTISMDAITIIGQLFINPLIKVL
jgi:hypothetical protein